VIKLVSLVVLLAPLAGCFKASDVPSCTVTCASDSDCPAGLTCAAGGKCSGGESCESLPPPPDTCTANAFVSCPDASTEWLCNATGDGVLTIDCGAPGCNETTQGCNQCVPDAVSCTSDHMGLQQCASDGSGNTPGQTCTNGCIDATVDTPAHCAYISPVWMPDVCDAPATEPSFEVTTNASLDTTLQATCNGGVITQASGPAICVLRYDSIKIDASRTLTVTGTRALALVADSHLDIDGVLDVSANGVNNGPGGGTMASGAKPSGSSGGGGAGFRSAGGPGGSSAGTGGAANGGAIYDPLTGTGAIGGPRVNNGITANLAFGGGGGGLALLVACRGTVTVPSTGLIDAGGGGGDAGKDTFAGAQVTLISAAGGGAGGYVILQGLAGVTVQGSLYANGGGGGGGDTTNDQSGTPGADGQRSLNAAVGGNANGGGAGVGGKGGTGSLSPLGGGGSSSSSGGGGGAAGYFQVYTPAGVSPSLTPTQISPAFETPKNVATR